jgi:hypothetical protein
MHSSAFECHQREERAEKYSETAKVRIAQQGIKVRFAVSSIFRAGKTLAKPTP